jgi:type II secretory pathway pseudopilin PulG
LLEILLALAILGGSLAALSQIVSTGAMAAREARDLSIARILCQTKVAEVMLNATAAISPQSVPPTPLEPFDSDSLTSFSYQVEVNPAPMAGLLAIRVTVEALDSDGGPPLARYSLSRWLIDPLLGLEQAEMEAEAAAAAEEQG